MADPKIADTKPMKIEEEAGKEYYWCACGQSQNQPYCDGSHAGTEFEPMCVEPDSSGRAFLCTCKHTETPPYCDGTHKKFRGK